MSRVEQVQKAMQRILWENILEDFLRALMGKYPVLGWPVFKDLILLIVEWFIVEPMFTILARWGVFTSIDWQNDEIYSAYKKEAEILIKSQGGTEWTKEQQKAFKDAARKMAKFNISFTGRV